jgi:osmoprotectant transport system ATP-binding protein
MDEPFGALDNITRAGVHAEFKSLEEIKNKTIILVTHDVDEAFELGHKISLMDKGKIIQTGTPKEILYRPANSFVRDFFARNRLLQEYKIATMGNINPFIEEQEDLYTNYTLSGNTSVWNVLQKLSSDLKNIAYYEKVIKAFNEYRKSHLN